MNRVTPLFIDAAVYFCLASAAAGAVLITKLNLEEIKRQREAKEQRERGRSW